MAKKKDVPKTEVVKSFEESEKALKALLDEEMDSIGELTLEDLDTENLAQGLKDSLCPSPITLTPDRMLAFEETVGTSLAALTLRMEGVEKTLGGILKGLAEVACTQDRILGTQNILEVLLVKVDDVIAREQFTHEGIKELLARPVGGCAAPKAGPVKTEVVVPDEELDDEGEDEAEDLRPPLPPVLTPQHVKMLLAYLPTTTTVSSHQELAKRMAPRWKVGEAAILQLYKHLMLPDPIPAGFNGLTWNEYLGW